MKATTIPASGADHSENDRPVLMLLPGMVCNGRAWRHQARHLAGRCEPRVADYGDARHMTDMARAVLAQAPERFLLAGHSMGARVAMEVQRLAPHRIIGLCFAGTEYGPCPAGEAGRRETETRNGLLALAREQGMPAMARRWLPALLPEARLADEPLVEEILAMISEHSPDQLEAHIAAGAVRPDSRAVLCSITAPTLLLAGAEDRLRPSAAHREMADLIPGARLVEIPGAGHMLTMENPEAVNAALDEWVAACRPFCSRGAAPTPARPVNVD
ncbi:MAG: alpha/beta hydrolase [Alcanivorax sp.]|nr:alpha/beta hydrolase [Alcanivorax sp.]